MYNCLRRVIQQVDYKYKGYLFVNDDVFVQPHLLLDLDVSNMWYAFNANHEYGMGNREIQFRALSLEDNILGDHMALVDFPTN